MPQNKSTRLRLIAPPVSCGRVNALNGTLCSPPSSGSVTFISVSRPLGKTLWSVATLTHGVIRLPILPLEPEVPGLPSLKNT